MSSASAQRPARTPRSAIHNPQFVRASVADLWSRPAAGSERVSQVLLGTPLVVLADSGDYAYVESPDAYRGWVALEEMTPSGIPAGQTHVVGDLIAPAYPDPEATGACLEVYYGTRLAAGETAGERRQVFLPDGPAWVPAACLRPEPHEPVWPPLASPKQFAEGEAPAEPARREPRPPIGVEPPMHSRALLTSGGAIPVPPLDIEALLADALRWVDVPYLWGGGSPRGVDCSGFVQILFRVHGRLLRRDARLQVRHGTAIPTDALRAGDLVFFGRSRWGLPTHVGIALSADEYIHAHDKDGHRVEVSPLAPALETVWGARRIR